MYRARKFLHRHLGGRLGNLLGDREGAGAVEFAFVAPLLVLIYMGAVEISVALSVDTKVSRAGNITLDLITQGTTITKTEMKDLVDVASGIMAPFNGDDVELKFTGITVDASKKAKVAWSWGSKTAKPYGKGTEVNIPTGLKIANAYYVRGEIVNTHQFLTSYPFLGGAAASIDMNETYFMRPRLGTDLDCTDC